MDFSNLKRSSSLSAITKAIEETSSKKFASDEREWQATVDKSGNGYAVIRFLPAPPQDGEDGLPWVRMFTHGFQGPGGQWYIENCPTTLGQECPVCEHNGVLWNTGEKHNKDIVSKQKRKLVHVTNILVITDPAKPENEGQVKIFKFGTKIFDKIKGAMNPDPGEEPLNPFDFWKGANFKLKIKKVEGYSNYDDSKFYDMSPVNGDDKILESIWKQESSLKAFVDPKVFKDYATLQKRLEKVLGSVVSKPVEKKEEKAESLSERFAKKEEEKPVEKKETVVPPQATATQIDPIQLDDEEDPLKSFQEFADDLN